MLKHFEDLNEAHEAVLRATRQMDLLVPLIQAMLRNLTRLTHVEQHLYDDLRDQRIRSDLRLEPERIRFSHLRHAVAELTR